MQPSSETATASAGATAHPRAEAMSTHATSHRAKGARAKPVRTAHRAMMERRTTAIPTEESQSHKQPTAAEQEGKNQDNNDEGQQCNALLSSQVVASTGGC
ncbi:MAG: hypothetical protein IKH57_03085 [Clostridia bacterium]|nr:hypothetical protein [Clostridia bacterium]